MKKIFLFIFLITNIALAQDKAQISGKILDGEMDNQPSMGANISIEGTTIGSSTDFDGNYILTVDPGTYTVVFSYVGYNTQKQTVTLAAGENITINKTLTANSLEEVVVTATKSRETESALLHAQKKAMIVKESIGAERLSKEGVSSAGAATAKVTGVVKSEGSGDIYIRGLGDRYLSTTMNGLPIPSDNIDTKNIDLSLFTTGIIKNVGISKTYTTSSYADQASGNVDIVSKDYTNKKIKIGISGGIQSNMITNDNVFSEFKSSVAKEDVTLGFYQRGTSFNNTLFGQSWNTTQSVTPINRSISISGGKKFNVGNVELAAFGAAAHSNSSEFRNGMFRDFRSNILNNAFDDVVEYENTATTTALFDLRAKFNDKNRVKYNLLFINKSKDYVFEAGRNENGYQFDHQPKENEFFVRDQNLKQTMIAVNQLLGNHKLSESNTLKWGFGANVVFADEPNRVRNEVNIYPNYIQFGNVGDFQQRKSNQMITDNEFNGLLEDEITLFKSIEDSPYKLRFGGNFRMKHRDFSSRFLGIVGNGIQVSSIDNLQEAFVPGNFVPGNLKNQRDAYEGYLDIYAGYANFDFANNSRKISGNIGVRYEYDNFDVRWDVTNFVGRTGKKVTKYNNVLPSVNLKFEVNDKNFIRFASSQTVTLPEFKELAPFEYNSPTGRVIRGNELLEKSDNYNVDLKWEYFYERGQLISLSAFYKKIKNPINLVRMQGSSGYFKYFNTSDNANVYGLEAEARAAIIKNEDGDTKLSGNVNATYMLHNQDLREEFQFNNKTESDLQGAANFITNASLSYNSRTEKELIATLTANYSSDKIFALGGPEDLVNNRTQFNEAIIEKGFVTLNFIASKKITDKLTVNASIMNILNPAIEQTQEISRINSSSPGNEFVESTYTETVQKYRNGQTFKLGLNYTF